MGESIPPESNSRSPSEFGTDPHESVTIAPPAPNFDELMRRTTPAPSPSSRSDQHFRAALDASARAGSSLADLSNIVRDLSSGLGGARAAHDQLVQEVGSLCALLGAANEEQLALRQRAAQLEQDLLSSREEAERELRAVTDRHDDFLAALLEEHEEALRSSGGTRGSNDDGDLRQRLRRAEQARQDAENACARAREALAQTERERDLAQARAEKLGRERDELRAEASQLRARLGTNRAVSATSSSSSTLPRSPSVHPPAALRLDAGELDSTLHPRGSTSSPRLGTAVPGQLPILRQKPEPTTRPLVDYSLGGDGLPSEKLEGARLSTAPPRK